MKLTTGVNFINILRTIGLRIKIFFSKNVESVKVSNHENVFIISIKHQSSSVSEHFYHISEENGKKSDFLSKFLKINCPRFIEHVHTIKVKSDHNNNNEQRSDNFVVHSLDNKINIKILMRTIEGRSSRKTVEDGRGREDTTVKASRHGWSGLHLEMRKKKLLREVHNISKMVLILSGDIETNPGPISEHVIDKTNMFICTYNVQGCGNFKKTKRIMNQLNK